MADVKPLKIDLDGYSKEIDVLNDRLLGVAGVDISGPNEVLAPVIHSGFYPNIPNSTIYVSKNGNDSNSGLSALLPKLTIQNAINSATTGLKFVFVLDGGPYIEHLSIIDIPNLVIFAPLATLGGSITVQGLTLGFQCHFDKINRDSSSTLPYVICFAGNTGNTDTFSLMQVKINRPLVSIVDFGTTSIPVFDLIQIQPRRTSGVSRASIVFECPEVFLAYDNFSGPASVDYSVLNVDGSLNNGGPVDVYFNSESIVSGNNFQSIPFAKVNSASLHLKCGEIKSSVLYKTLNSESFIKGYVGSYSPTQFVLTEPVEDEDRLGFVEVDSPRFRDNVFTNSSDSSLTAFPGETVNLTLNGNQTVNLSNLALNGQKIRIKSSSSGTKTIQGEGGLLIDGTSSCLLQNSGDFIEFTFNQASGEFKRTSHRNLWVGYLQSTYQRTSDIPDNQPEPGAINNTANSFESVLGYPKTIFPDKDIQAIFDLDFNWSLNDGAEDLRLRVVIDGVIYDRFQAEPKEATGTDPDHSNRGTNQKYTGSFKSPVFSITTSGVVIDVQFAPSANNDRACVWAANGIVKEVKNVY